MTVFRPRFEHLRRLTDERGLYEHCRGDEPRQELGYCTDDAARALILVSGEGSEVADLSAVYRRFVVAAVAADGSCHNRCDPAGHWRDEPSLGDWWGRSIWGLAFALETGADDPVARKAMERLLARRSPYRRSLAYATLGAARIADRVPAAHRLVADAVGTLMGHENSAGWPWPEPRLTYDNALLAHALLLAGQVLGRDDLVARGLARLWFLAGVQRVDDHLSLVPVGGRGPGEGPPGYDQQPIEVASLALAGATAYELTAAREWAGLVGAATGWFLGANDAGIAMIDTDTGAGYDGLTVEGRNQNRGAESTLAANLTLQQAHRSGLSPCPLPSAFTRTRHELQASGE